MPSVASAPVVPTVHPTAPTPSTQLCLDMLALPGGAAALRLWSAEEPHLYLLLLELVVGGSTGSSSSCGEVLEIEACQVGCCGVDWRGGGTNAEDDVPPIFQVGGLAAGVRVLGEGGGSCGWLWWWSSAGD